MRERVSERVFVFFGAAELIVFAVWITVRHKRVGKGRRKSWVQGGSIF